MEAKRGNTRAAILRRSYGGRPKPKAFGLVASQKALWLRLCRSLEASLPSQCGCASNFATTWDETASTVPWRTPSGNEILSLQSSQC